MVWCVSCRSRDEHGLGGAPGLRSFFRDDAELTPGSFVSSLLGELRRARQDEPPRIVGVVHGFAVTHEGALRTAAAIDRVTRQVSPESQTVAFSWPAQGSVAAYLDDRSEARWAAEHFAGLLLDTVRLLQDERCTAQLVLVAHSMGAYLLACAARAAAEAIGFGRFAVFAEVILLAPDLDANALEPGKLAEYLPHFARRVHVYHSRRDGALLASAAKRAGVTGERLGRHGPARIDALPDHIVTVDCTATVHGHSDYFVDPTVLADVVEVMRGTDRELIPGRVADPVVGPRFWRLGQMEASG